MNEEPSGVFHMCTFGPFFYFLSNTISHSLNSHHGLE